MPSPLIEWGKSVTVSEAFELFSESEFCGRRNAVHKEETVQVVALVLETTCQEPGAIYMENGAVQLGQGGFNVARSGNVGADVMYAQAAFCKEVLFAVGLDNRVDEHERHDVSDGAHLAVDGSGFRFFTVFFVFGNIDDNQADIFTYLWCS